MTVIQTKPEPSCPDCGGQMRLIRKGQGKTQQPFWGCTEYPDCRATVNIKPDGTPDVDTGPFRLGDFDD